MTMPRLTLTGILILALFAMPRSVKAQPTRVYRVGVVLLGGPHSATIDGLRDGLRELGLEEGKQFVFHVRDSKGDVKAVERRRGVSKGRGRPDRGPDHLGHSRSQAGNKERADRVLCWDRSGIHRSRRELPETRGRLTGIHGQSRASRRSASSC